MKKLFLAATILCTIVATSCQNHSETTSTKDSTTTTNSTPPPAPADNTGSGISNTGGDAGTTPASNGSTPPANGTTNENQAPVDSVNNGTDPGNSK